VDWESALDTNLTSDERCALEQLREVEGIARKVKERARRFTTTEWSLVLTAAEDDGPASRKALEALCRRYWYPVYAEVRFAGYDAENSRDLTQGFFLQLLDRRALAVADPARGRFRNFLKTSIKNYLSDEASRSQAQKRGGGESPVPLDLAGAEKQYARELAHTQTPEKAFDRRWARALLERALNRLRQEMEKAGSLDRFERLSPLLTGSGDSTRYKDLATRWDTTEAAIKMAVHRMRRRLRVLGRLEVAHTVDDPREVEEEIRFLLSAIDS
jgi:RNA polymerase sigma-70 factor (ECF subfamily)